MAEQLLMLGIGVVLVILAVAGLTISFILRSRRQIEQQVGITLLEEDSFRTFYLRSTSTRSRTTNSLSVPRADLSCRFKTSTKQ